MALSEIIGHARPLAILGRALRTGRIAHAYLFVGPDGIGKATVARAFAKAILCTARAAEEACETCDACRKAAHGNHPDLVIIEPEETQILIDQVRELRRQMIHRPLEAGWRVIVVDQAHNLNLQAANALLKILEEPPDGNVMLLIARSIASLLPTIVSRCQVVHFSTLGTAEVARYLERSEGLGVDEALRVASQAQGSIRRGLEFMDYPAQQEGEKWLEFLDALGGIRAAGALEQARQWAGTRQEVTLKLEFLQRIFRDLVAVHLGSRALGHRELGDRLARAASGWDLRSLLLGWEGIAEALRGLERNWNPQLVLDQLFLGLRGLNQERRHGGRGMRPLAGGERA